MCVKRIEYVLVSIIAILLCIPILSWVSSGDIRESLKTYSDSKKIFDFKALAKNNKEVTKKFDENFIGRNSFLEWTNEIWFRAFKVCPAKSADITVGTNDVLYKNSYLREYCLERPGATSVETLTSNIKRFQDLCTESGIKTLLIITPSKASVMPEYIPKSWRDKYSEKPRAYDHFLHSLNKLEVDYVDGVAITKFVKAVVPSPIFPKGGIHWTSYGALHTANAVFLELNRSGFNFSLIENTAPNVVYKPRNTDRDLLRMMELKYDWQYPCTDFTILPADKPSDKTVTFIGGSFNWEIAGAFTESQHFIEVSNYFYYKKARAINPQLNAVFNIVERPVNTNKLLSDIFSNDVILLEVNESRISSAVHLDDFFNDAFQIVENGAFPRRKYESYYKALPLEHNKLQSLSIEEFPSGKLDFTRGFSNADNSGVWSISPKCSINLQIANNSSISENPAVTFIVNPYLSKDAGGTQEFSLYLNSAILGQWEFTQNGQREIVVNLKPEQIPNDGLLQFEVVVSHPEKPSKHSESRDIRELGIRIHSVKFSR